MLLQITDKKRYIYNNKCMQTICRLTNNSRHTFSLLMIIIWLDMGKYD